MYPKRKFHPAGGSIVVNDVHHETAVGPEWLDMPPIPADEIDAHEGDELLADLAAEAEDAADDAADDAPDAVATVAPKPARKKKVGA